jgi:hypothetical protein
MLLLAVMLGCGKHGLPNEEPRGLLLRKGLLRWQTPVKEARNFVEENIRPTTPNLLAGNKDEQGFRCEEQTTRGVTRCVWACCVDLGEKDKVHFATLWFYNDGFYAYDVAFDTVSFTSLFSALEGRLGKPSAEEQESQFSPTSALGEYGISSYIINTKRWDTGNTVVRLSDRGGQGRPLAGHIYVVAVRIEREIPTGKRSEPTAKLPF